MGEQSKRKALKRSVDMSLSTSTEDEIWIAPPPAECDESTYTMPLAEGTDHSDRAVVRVIHHLESFEMVRFAIIQQTFHSGRWRDVCSVDSCHDDDVHLHRYARSTDARVGTAEVLMPLRSISDVLRGYDAAYSRVFDDWSANKERWRHA